MSSNHDMDIQSSTSATKAGGKKVEQKQQQQRRVSNSSIDASTAQANSPHRPKQQQQHQQGRGNKDKGSLDSSSHGQQKETRGGGGNSSADQAGKKNAAAPAASNLGISATTAPRLALFDHLPRKRIASNAHSIEEIDGVSLHPATIKLGILYRKGIILEDDDRVVALVTALSNIVEDYVTPPNKNFSWDLDKHISKQVQHLINCRQHSVGMGNLIRHFRHSISHVSPDISEADAKATLNNVLLTFLEERIVFPRDTISMNCANAIHENDVILTYGSSPLIRYVLETVAATKKFRLVIVDSRPLNYGFKTLEVLSPKLHCVYTPLSGAAVAMRDATRVILGASALLSNGAMLAPAGTAMIAALAKANRVPVIVAAETYKFSERNQLDAIVFNELGNELEIVTATKVTKDKEVINQITPQTQNVFCGAAEAIHHHLNSSNTKSAGHSSTSDASSTLPFQVINLRYDLTPISNISVVATEIGMIPPTSIPVLLRELNTKDNVNIDA